MPRNSAKRNHHAAENLKAGDVLLIVGPSNLVDEDAAFQSYVDANTPFHWSPLCNGS
ncbi:MAG TPA: hypothetical protein VMY42_05835 [Thermoguttaceae bacterium]|nr:hypothetical protein [Thermoguttaceae bacterium]